MNSSHLYQLFKDPNLRQAMAEKGFVRLPFFNGAVVEELRKIYESIGPKIPLSGFGTTTSSENEVLKKQIFDQLKPLYAEKVEAIFQDYKLLGSSFLHKAAGETGFLPLHQDWTVTDEAYFRTLTIWIPLVDTTAENGAMQVIPGSHQWMNLLRGPNLPIAISEVNESLQEKLELQSMRAGEALIFDHSLFHASTLNQSDFPRIAVTYGICHKETPLCFWYHHDQDLVDRFEKIAVPDDFFLRYPKIGTRPQLGRSLGFYQHDLSKVQARDLDEIEDHPIQRPMTRFYGPSEANVQPLPLSITQNKAWNQQLAEKGYVLFPLLDGGTVQYLRDFFLANQKETVERFYASVHDKDTDFRLRMDAEIRRTVRILLGRVLDEGELLGSAFIAKPKGNPGILPPHSDWNIVDEREFRSYNLWIPLVDTTLKNGAIYVIPESHTWMDDFRGPGIPNPYAELKDEIWAAMQPLEMEAGMALLYDHRLLHASPANQTDELRIACVSGIKPKQAAMRYYHSDGKTIKSYASNPAFYLEGNPEEGPADLPFLEVVGDTFPSVSSDDSKNWMKVDGEANIEAVPVENSDKRSFFQTYAPRNIWKELMWRIKGR